MAQLQNPEIEIIVYGLEETFSIKDADMFVRIYKDLSSEPNEAEIQISNLKVETQDKFQNAADQTTPIEIYLTPAGQTNLALAFKGEIEEAYTEQERSEPGVETFINCTSQKQQTRDAYFEKTYAAGTPRSQIVGDLIEAIGVPVGIVEGLPSGTVEFESFSGTASGDYGDIAISESFSGPAFPILQQYVFDLGMYCYILDGKIYVSSVSQPESPNVKNLEKHFLRNRPQKTKRTEDLAIEMKTIAEASGLPLFKGKRSRKKKKKKQAKIVGANDYVDYTAVDKTVMGLKIEAFLLPDFQPDDVLTIPDYEFLGDKKYHVQSIEMVASTGIDGGDWDMYLDTDDYDESGGDLDAGAES
jgi:hypothetical protein